MFITEALAEIKTLGKRIEAKRGGLMPYLARQDGLKDPLDKEGGSREFVRRERQAIRDLEERIITLRRGIQVANYITSLTVQGVERPIQDWLTWRREVAQGQKALLTSIRQAVQQARQQATQKGFAVVASGTPTQPTDLLINVDEAELAGEIDRLETTLGELDGQLSLKNATVSITL